MQRQIEARRADEIRCAELAQRAEQFRRTEEMGRLEAMRTTVAPPASTHNEAPASTRVARNAAASSL